jgi:hypothetical protein
VKIALPANAKITAFVWRGRSRPNANHGARLNAGHAIWIATMSPMRNPTIPQMIVAQRKRRTMVSS